MQSFKEEGYFIKKLKFIIKKLVFSYINLLILIKIIIPFIKLLYN